jgi:cell division protein FtsL
LLGWLNHGSRGDPGTFAHPAPFVLERHTGNLFLQGYRRTREMRQFGFALVCLFLLVMGYAFQHFKAIEYGYKIEALKSQREGLIEMNRALRLEEASLRDPERIDHMARELGLQSPQAGQVIRMDVAGPDASGSVVASMTPVSVISAR